MFIQGGYIKKGRHIGLPLRVHPDGYIKKADTQVCPYVFIWTDT